MKEKNRNSRFPFLGLCILCAAVIVAAAVLTIFSIGGMGGASPDGSGDAVLEKEAAGEERRDSLGEDGGADAGMTENSLPESGMLEGETAEDTAQVPEIVIRSADDSYPTGQPGHEGGAETEDGQGGESGQEVENGQEAENSEIVLAFAGDIYLSDHVLNAYQKGGIGGVLGESLRREAGGADLFIVNEEFPFSNRGTPAPDKQYTFRLPPERVSLFREMEIDLVTLANNHALDYGTEALLDTCSTLEAAGIPYVGAGKDLEQAKAMHTEEVKGRTIGFIGATRVIPVADWAASSSRPGMFSAYDPSVLLEEIRKGKEICDYLVVYIHWGIERADTPESYQRQMGKQMIDAGADLVIGSHPHVLQGIEYYQGKPIVYSLGNYVFGSSIPRTVLLKVQWDGEESRLSVIPASSSAGYTREITDEGGRQELFTHLESISFGAQVDEEGQISPAEEGTSAER